MKKMYQSLPQYLHGDSLAIVYVSLTRKCNGFSKK